MEKLKKDDLGHLKVRLGGGWYVSGFKLAHAVVGGIHFFTGYCTAGLLQFFAIWASS
jgi:hypothetical protein